MNRRFISADKGIGRPREGTSHDAMGNTTPSPAAATRRADPAKTGALPPTRLEAFSDGVFAVAATLLVVNIAAPSPGQGPLWDALRHQWPSFAAYAVSFLIIGIIWVNHHGLFHRIAHVDRPLLFLNVFLLLDVVFIPFPTRLLSEYLQAGPDSHVAAAVYSATMLVMAIGMSLIWGYAVYHPDLLEDRLDPQVARSTLPRFSSGTLVYAGTIGVAFISASLCLTVHALLALYYVFDQVSQERPRSKPLDDHPVRPVEDG